MYRFLEQPAARGKWSKPLDKVQTASEAIVVAGAEERRRRGRCPRWVGGGRDSFPERHEPNEELGTQ